MVPTPRIVAPVVLAVLIVTSGCIGVLAGTEPLVVEAEPVGVTTAAQDDAGYEEVRREADPLTREITVLGQTREVQVTNHIAEYSRSVQIGPIGSGEFARFVVLSTPAVEVLGRTFNPVGDMSNRELAEFLQDEYEGIEDIRPAGERSASLLETTTTVSTYTADARLQGTGQSVEVKLHVAQVRHGEDFVVAIAVHPAMLPGEDDRVDRMLAGIRHEE